MGVLVLLAWGCAGSEPLTTAAVQNAESSLASSTRPESAAASVPGDLAWSQFRGVNGNGIAPASNPPTTWSAGENVRWKAPLPGPGASAPIVVGERVYVTCSSGFGGEGGGRDISRLQRHLIAFDLATGEQRFQRDLSARLPEQEEIRENYGYAGSTPVSDGELIYCFFGKSGVHAFTLDGEPRWEADVGANVHGWGSAASPILVGDSVIVNASVESESLVALDKRTGDEQWRARGIKESWNTPIVADDGEGRTELVVAIFGSVLGLDPATGGQNWSCDTDIGWYMVPSLVTDGKRVYCIGGRSGGGLAVGLGGSGNVTRSHRSWWIDKGSNVPTPILYEGHLYWAHESNSIAYCAEAATGEIVYEERLPRAGQVYASPVLAGGRIYYLSRDGRMFVIAAKPEFEQLAVNELEERGMFNATPAIAGDDLLIRSDRYLYCIGE
jgi:outer membrane protein assembly factor BamB